MFLIDKEHRCTYIFEICVQCLYLHSIKESSYPEMTDKLNMCRKFMVLNVYGKVVTQTV